MSDAIQNISLKFACDANWDEMLPEGDGRHCKLCDKKVYDFTNAKQLEFLQIMAENNNHVCGRFLPAQMAAKPLRLPLWKKWVSAAMVLIGINLTLAEVEAQNSKSTKPIQIISSDQPTDDMLFQGMVAGFEPEFKGGQKALALFLSQNLHYKNHDGKVFVTFEITALGQLKNPKIVRGLDAATNQEVLRVLKLSPKWIPPTINGKMVAARFTLPITFAKQ